MKHKNDTWRIPMANLQLFAEGDDDGPDKGDGGGSAAGAGLDDENKPMTFDAFLKEGENQAEFDRRVQKAIQSAVTKAQQKWQVLTDDKLTEAEKLAKMTKEEKAEYKANKLQKELDDYKKKEALSDMSKTARKMLSDEDTVNEAVKNALKGPAPKAGIGGKTTATKEQIMAIKNPSERQRMIAENITLFQ